MRKWLNWRKSKMREQKGNLFVFIIGISLLSIGMHVFVSAKIASTDWPFLGLPMITAGVAMIANGVMR